MPVTVFASLLQGESEERRVKHSLDSCVTHILDPMLWPRILRHDITEPRCSVQCQCSGLLPYLIISSIRTSQRIASYYFIFSSPGSPTFGEKLSTIRVRVASVSVSATLFVPFCRGVVADRRVDHFPVELKQKPSVLVRSGSLYNCESGFVMNFGILCP